jgi:hypothetical protein
LKLCEAVTNEFIKGSRHVFTSSVFTASAWFFTVRFTARCIIFTTQAAEELLRKAVGKGAYEMAYSQQENALWLATSQSRKLIPAGWFTA